MNVSEDDAPAPGESQSAADVQFRPTALARRYRQYHPPDALITDDMLLSVGDLAVRFGDDTLIQKAMHHDPEKRGELPFLPSLKIGRTRRIRGKRALQWLDEVEALFSTASLGARAET